ncbi:MAG: aminotransferase class IV [Bacteroidales bacterium]|nr:aminotransferase class IV [Bacteroidales bacterium]
MCLLLESIRFENNKFHHVSYHQERMNRSVSKLFNTKAPNLEKALENIQDIFIAQPNQTYKFRVLYNASIHKTEWEEYKKPQIGSLKIVAAQYLDYTHKYAARENLNVLFQQKSDCDDILIAKNGRITDTLFCNVVFFNGTQWITPAYPLLKGTQREFLLQQEIIRTADIRIEDLKLFSKARLINAMLPFESAPEIKTDQIFS